MIQEIKNGDQTAVSRLYREYRPDFIAWMTSRYHCTTLTARDIYQDTMLTITTKAQRGELDDIKCTMKTYIYGVAKNKYRELLRRERKYVQADQETLDVIEHHEPMQEDHEDLALLKEALIQLGEPCKTILELYYFHGMQMEEILDHMPYKNSKTVKNMKYKCLLRLRGIFHNIRKDKR